MERLRKVAALNREISVLKSQLQQSQQRADQVERERSREVAALNREISSLRLELANQSMNATSRQVALDTIQLNLAEKDRLLEDQQRVHQRMQEESRRIHEEQLCETYAGRKSVCGIGVE